MRHYTLDLYTQGDQGQITAHRTPLELDETRLAQALTAILPHLLFDHDPNTILRIDLRRAVLTTRRQTPTHDTIPRSVPT